MNEAEHIKSYEEITGRPVLSCTCLGCDARKKCEYAFDAYNEDGDCLAEK